MQQHGILLGALSGALIVLTGGLYALFYALGCLRKSRRLIHAAYASYAVLAVSSAVLADALNLSGAWSLVVLVMLVGYLLLPRAIWHLCVGTHKDRHAAAESATDVRTPQ